MPSVQVNGIELFYEEQGEGPPLVFLHGAAGNHISWWQQVPHFRDRYRCISIDHRGFGRSLDVTGEGGSRFVDDLEALLMHLEVEEPVTLVAQSMGGRTAIGFAVRHPERTRAVVMADTWGFFDWPELQQRVAELREQTAEAGQALEQRALGRAFQEAHPDRRFLYEQIAGLNPPRDLRRMVDGAPSREEVAALQVPFLFIVGSEDSLTPPEILKEVHGFIEGSEFREFPGNGHSVYFEDPEGFNAAVDDFLARRSS
jgi:3-oxoadipate enol-lactonase